MKRVLIILLLTTFVGSSDAQDQAVELGKVNWLRNWEKAVEESERSGKGIFILFQEVPGCHTCTTFGNQVLSHPLMVEIIEDRFIPLAIYNNVDGYDRKILNKFKEPTWNNPVVRIVNAKGEDVVPRKSGVYSLSGNLNRMVDALLANNELVPSYIYTLLNDFSVNDSKLKTTYLSMYCFWTGEKEIAKIDGVVSTEAGYMHGDEVVKVEYLPEITSPINIGEQARKKKCADGIFDDDVESVEGFKTKKSGKYKKDKESKYYLYKSVYRYVPMTANQSMKVNSLLGELSNPDHLLSPRQMAIYEETKEKTNGPRPNYQDIYGSWDW